MKESQCHQLLSLCFQDYISQFKFKSVVAQDLIDFFLTCFPELKDAAVAQKEGEDLRLTPLYRCLNRSCDEVIKYRLSALI